MNFRLLETILVSSVIAFTAIITFIGVAHASTTVTQVFNGGTGTSSVPTYGQVLVGNSGGTYTPTATSSLGISGGGSGGISWPWNEITNWATSTNATTTAEQAPSFFASSTKASQFPYASSTAVSISGSSWLGTVLTGTWNATAIGNVYGGTGQNTSAWSALPVVTSGTWSQYGGTSCTNQFVRSINGSGVATCNSVSLTTDVTGTLPLASGGTNASLSGASQLVAMNSGNTALTTISGCTASSLLLTCTSASTTNLTANLSQIIGDGSGSDYITTTHGFSLTYATSTAWTGSTTALFVMSAPYSVSLKQAICFTDAGTLNVQFQYGSTPTFPAMLTASSTNGLQTFQTNTTPAKGNKIEVVFGTPASSPTQINCTGTFTQTGT